MEERATGVSKGEGVLERELEEKAVEILEEEGVLERKRPEILEEGGFVGRGLGAVETGLNLLSVTVLFLLMFYVVAEVTMRSLFNSPLPGHLEASQLLIVTAIFLAAAYTQARRGHVGVDLLVRRMPERPRRMLEVLTLSLALVAFAIITWFSWIITRYSFEMGDVTPTAYIPTWWSKAAVPLGGFFLCLRFLVQIGENLRFLFASGGKK